MILLSHYRIIWILHVDPHFLKSHQSRRQIAWEEKVGQHSTDQAMGDFLFLSVFAVFEDVWNLNSGLFIGSAVDEGPTTSLSTPGESWGSFWLFGFPFPSCSALNLYHFLVVWPTKRQWMLRHNMAW